MRTMTVWAPDWPVVAALEGVNPDVPVAVLARHQVLACSPAARREGVRRGMRRRDAQARCPDLRLIDHEPEADARAFEEVLVEIERLTPGVAPLRPGLCALRAPSRYYGGELEAGAVIAERLVELGVWDLRIGIADGLFAAEQAARHALPQDTLVVAPGGSAAFLHDLPVDVLDDPVGGLGSGTTAWAAQGTTGGSDLVDLLRRMGLRTLGDFASLAPSDVHTRFGGQGALLHRMARGLDPEPVSPRAVPPELTVPLVLEPPLELAEQVAFSARTTAERFVGQLADLGLVCTGVRIEVDVDGSVASSRTWLHPRWFGAADLLDRLRWQLGSGLGGPADGLRFVPEVVESLGEHAESLFGAGRDERVERGVARVQSMVGHASVLAVQVQGGRGPAARRLLTPWGEKPRSTRPAGLPWPGSLPPPSPGTVLVEPVEALVVGGEGLPVGVTGRGVVTGEPAAFRARPGDPLQAVASWAGPWPIEELWWDEHEARRVARFQVVGADGSAWLMLVEDGRWWTEARYD